MGIVFVGGNVALDYVGTLNERFSSRVEQLNSPDDFGRWLVGAALVDRAPQVSESDFRRAIKLNPDMDEVRAQVDYLERMLEKREDR